MSIQKYAIFAGYNYDASGGYCDIYDFTETLEEATEIYNKILTTKTSWNDKPAIWKEMNPLSKFRNLNPSSKRNSFEWAHIVDLETKKVVLNSKTK